MTCTGKRFPTPLSAPPALPMIGAKGFLKLTYIGTEPAETLPGQVTGASYPFDERNPLYVDRRDATYLLGPEFEEVT